MWIEMSECVKEWDDREKHKNEPILCVQRIKRIAITYHEEEKSAYKVYKLFHVRARCT